MRDEEINTMTRQTISPKAYCSKKLLDLLDETSTQNQTHCEVVVKNKIVRELTQRGHYLTELSDRGLIGDSRPLRH